MKERPILFSAPMVRALLDGSKTQTRRVVKHQPPDDTGNVFTGLYHPTVIDKRGDEQPGEETFGAWSADGEWATRCPYGQPGDRLWVREAHWWFKDEHDPVTGYFPPPLTVEDVQFRADGDDGRKVWRPSIHMPRWASRITLEIVSVRVERLQDISEADAIAEGCKPDAPVTWWQGYKDAGEKLGLMHTQVQGDEPPDWMIEPHKMPPTPWLVRNARHHYRQLWESINGPGSWDLNPWVWAVEFRRLP